MQIVERRGPSTDVIQGLLERDARDKGFFAERERVESLAATLTTPTRTVTVHEDEEHQAFALVIEDRSGGYPRHHRIDQDFVTTGEFRTLASSYQDVKGIRGPMIVKTTAVIDTDADAEETRQLTPVSRPPTRRASVAPLSTKRPSLPPSPSRSTRHPLRSRPPRPAKDADVQIQSVDELVEFFTAAGKKGVAINRYKGLGEMNPDTLWATTMNPESRTLAQVRAEDHLEADLMFTTLMGDQVEPRRKFIEDNALDVKNLDI